MPALKACVYRGMVSHTRLEPVRHSFAYPVWFFGFDLDALEDLDTGSQLFGYNRRALFSLRDGDYLGPEPGSIRQKLQTVLDAHAGGLRPARVWLVTAARFMGRVFNPVSFYYCYDEAQRLACAVAEVNNTFGERHLYLLPDPQPAKDGKATARATKCFHVSPFNDRSGEYAFSFSSPSPTLDIHVDLLREGRMSFQSSMTGEAQPFNPPTLRKAVAAYPLSTALTAPRILAQAARLYFGKHLPVFAKPAPASDQTRVVAAPSLMERTAMRLTLQLFQRIQRGQLDLTLPNGSHRQIGGTEAGHHAALHIREYSFFVRLVRDGDVGFGEAFTDELWSSPDTTTLLKLFIANRDLLDDHNLASAFLGRVINRAFHLIRSNSKSGSRRNISAHYDLSNEFFSLFLDETMLYSSAVFADEAEDLAVAQRRKLGMLLDKAHLLPGHHLLEIGSGWGALAIEAVKKDRLPCHLDYALAAPVGVGAAAGLQGGRRGSHRVPSAGLPRPPRLV